MCQKCYIPTHVTQFRSKQQQCRREAATAAAVNNTLTDAATQQAANCLVLHQSKGSSQDQTLRLFYACKCHATEQCSSVKELPNLHQYRNGRGLDMYACAAQQAALLLLGRQNSCMRAKHSCSPLRLLLWAQTTSSTSCCWHKHNRHTMQLCKVGWYHSYSTDSRRCSVGTAPQRGTTLTTLYACVHIAEYLCINDDCKQAQALRPSSKTD